LTFAKKIKAMTHEASMPTTLSELAVYLREECYQPAIFHVGPNWSHCGDTFCIEHTPSGYEAFYVERGKRSDPIWIESSEAAACRAFLALLDRERFSRSHCIAFTKERSEIEAIEQKLVCHGIQFTRNDIPVFGGPNDPRYRLFVIGRDKIIIDQLISSGQIPPVSLR
jgi:hypothetical protein